MANRRAVPEPQRGGPGVRRRAALTLLELIATVMLLGILAAVAAARFGPSALTDFSSQGDGRRLALDLSQCQRRAIASGHNHFLSFTIVSGQATGYTVNRRVGAVVTEIDAPRTFPAGLAVTVTQTTPELTFDGSSLAAFQATLTGPHQTWRVTLIQATGVPKLEKLP